VLSNEKKLSVSVDGVFSSWQAGKTEKSTNLQKTQISLVNDSRSENDLLRTQGLPGVKGENNGLDPTPERNGFKAGPRVIGGGARPAGNRRVGRSQKREGSTCTLVWMGMQGRRGGKATARKLNKKLNREPHSNSQNALGNAELYGQSGKVVMKCTGHTFGLGNCGEPTQEETPNGTRPKARPFREFTATRGNTGTRVRPPSWVIRRRGTTPPTPESSLTREDEMQAKGIQQRPVHESIYHIVTLGGTNGSPLQHMTARNQGGAEPCVERHNKKLEGDNTKKKITNKMGTGPDASQQRDGAENTP